MPPRKKAKRKIESYSHDEKRVNNPPVGLVTPKTDPDKGEKQTYEYDPHIDPSLQWAGKAERTSFEVPVRSLHVHERIDPRTVMEAVRRRNGNGNGQARLFEDERDTPLREAIEFYKHKHDWSNRLVAGDSLLVMSSLLNKEDMAGKVQCVYMDPPYGIKYGSNFQPFVGNRDVKDGKDDHLTAEPEMIKAFRDTWELGIHSYLSYMRDRLRLAKELLTESGSVFVQISDENVHHIREIMDEVFGAENSVSLVSFRKTVAQTTKLLSTNNDYIIWYAKNKEKVKFRRLLVKRQLEESVNAKFQWLEKSNGEEIRLSEATQEEINEGQIFAKDGLDAQTGGKTSRFVIEYKGLKQTPKGSRGWRTSKKGIERLIESKRITVSGNKIVYKRYFEDFPFIVFTNNWYDTMNSFEQKSYVVQTNMLVIARCLLMTTDPGDLVFDPTCGSGTTAYVAEQWGRRWITCDTSRVALTLAKQRLMTSTFDYYKLAYPEEGVSSGFEYKTVPHITLKSIANDEPPAQETLFDQPLKDTNLARVTGPFTVEAVPAPSVAPIEDFPAEPADEVTADASIARSGETLRQSEWRDELLKTGIRGKGGQRISFSRVSPLPFHWLHAEAETKPDDSGSDNVKEAATAYKTLRAVISFGPEHAPLEQRQVENALQEAQKMAEKPNIVVFAAFQFDPEAAKDIDETVWGDTVILKAQMNSDMQTDDLKKKRSSDDSFWLIGQPDINVARINRGPDSGQWEVEVHGFDYFNTKSGEIESGGEERIAVWMLDTDYDGRCLYPSQVFFPMAGVKDGWTRLAKNLKAEIDEELIEAYRGTLSLPFELGKNSRIAVKIVDDRGIESLKVVEIKEAKIR
ncbi:MAG: site-specific DNA-methyltransferase [Candidatus Dadabacteria bacterium]|nr:site-specific DNA-methyltransferase [Candidatus Dadabacteria bacterium]